MKANLVCDRLRRARMAAGLQGKDLAKRLGISRPYLSQIERGQRHPSPELLMRLASELQISFDDPAGAPPVSDRADQPAAPVCLYPEGCDLEAELGQVKERLAAMEGQLDTVIRLLGASLHLPQPAADPASHSRKAG